MLFGRRSHDTVVWRPASLPQARDCSPFCGPPRCTSLSSVDCLFFACALPRLLRQRAAFAAPLHRAGPLRFIAPQPTIHSSPYYCRTGRRRRRKEPASIKFFVLAGTSTAPPLHRLSPRSLRDSAICGTVRPCPSRAKIVRMILASTSLISMRLACRSRSTTSSRP